MLMKNVSNVGPSRGGPAQAVTLLCAAIRTGAKMVFIHELRHSKRTVAQHRAF